VCVIVCAVQSATAISVFVMLYRCFTDFAHAKFPMWLGYAMAAHEYLAGGIIATAGALFAAWLAYSALQDQIGMARRNEQEAKRLDSERLFEKAASDVDIMKLAFGYLQSIGNEFPQPSEQNLGREAFASVLLKLRRLGRLQISANAARASDAAVAEFIRLLGTAHRLLRDGRGVTTRSLRFATILTLILHIYSPELLHPLTCIHLRSEDIALAIDSDVVQRREHAHLSSRPTEAAKRLLRGAVDDAHLAVHAVDHIDEFLLLIGREHEIVD
jgi:hypothetical protein